MPSKPTHKKRKGKTVATAELPQKLSEVEKKFYELEIADLNKRLANLRSHNEKLEKENEEFQSKFQQKEVDRQDVLAHLDRTLKIRNSTIVELETKLAESIQSHKDESKKLNDKIHHLEDDTQSLQKKLMHDIQLLETECRSLQEFRLQRDDLLMKFEFQEQTIRDQDGKHKKILYETERKLVLDKKNLRETVENKLLDLSDEFTKQNEMRVAASTQRLVRENVALNLEVDRLMKTVDRLQAENHEMTKKRKENAVNREIDQDQIKRLIITDEQQLKIIRKLTSANEMLRSSRQPHEFIKTSRNTFEELTECRRKLKILERHVNQINFDNRKMKNESDNLIKEYERIKGILKTVRLTIKSAVRGETVQDDPEFREHQRRNFASDLLHLLEDLEFRNPKSSLATLPSLSNLYFEDFNEFGWPKTYETVYEILAKLPIQNPDQSIIDTPTVSSISAKMQDVIESSQNVLIDVESGSLTFSTESERSESLVDSENEKPKFDMKRKSSSSPSDHARIVEGSEVINFDEIQSKHSTNSGSSASNLGGEGAKLL